MPPRECFFPNCESDALPSHKYCLAHARAANKWMGDERYLDSLEERRKVFRQDDRPSVAEEMSALIGWDPLGELDGDRVDGD